MRRSALRIRKSPLPLLAVLAAFLALQPLAVAPRAAAADANYSALVVDANSGKTLFARSADSKRYPASLTKMMTLYLLFEELSAKRVSLTSKFSVSANAARQPPSKLGVKAGSSIKVEDAILALVTKSANDVAVVVAENISGSVPTFAKRMTSTARALGMSSTTFRNPHGLPDSGQVTTARDLVKLALALQDRFPTYYEYFGQKSFSYRGARYRNHNRLLGSVEGVDGIKTGYTRASGFNLVTNVDRGGRHIVAVVMGGRTASRRDAHMRELISKYLPRAAKGARSTPLLIVETGDVGGDAVAVADARVPRARPEFETSALGYAAAEEPRDVVAAAMAEVESTEGDVSDATEVEVIDAAPDDPIALRIQSASTVAEFADIAFDDGGSDPIARLTQLARIRAGVDDVIASAPLPEDRAAPATTGSTSQAGWHIQIGAVPTQEGAQALLDKAQASMGQVLASAEPVMQEVAKGGTTLYRARFAGFSDKEEARDACLKLKRKSFACLAVPN